LRHQRWSARRAGAVQCSKAGQRVLVARSRATYRDVLHDVTSLVIHCLPVIHAGVSVRPTSVDSMSYKIDLSDLKRDGATSLTQQVVDRSAAAIEAGDLEPGEKLPPTRELAELVGVNHLTAAR